MTQTWHLKGWSLAVLGFVLRALKPEVLVLALTLV